MLPWAQIRYHLYDADLVRLARALEFPVLLSSNPEDPASRFTIFSAEPLVHLSAQVSDGDQTDQDLSDSFLNFSADLPSQEIPDAFSTLPFICGKLGYCSYSFGESINRLSQPTSLAFPDMFFGYYTWSYVFDHHTQTGLISFSPKCTPELRDKILKLLHHDQTAVAEHTESIQTNLHWKKSQSYESYKNAFCKVQDYIHAGDCYQVNLTQRFECDLCQQNTPYQAIDFYLQKQHELNTPFSAFLSFSNDCHLMSFSPEQFIRIENRIIESKPIKGTIANTEDASNINRLQQSLKNRAENVMIVDLLRNDLSKVCKVNSVHVPELFKIETFKNVHHMVSHIRGELREDISELEAFLSCFPGGSITGAPKIRAMEIIRELEQHSRSAYCGSVFYWNDNGNFDSNILIRTIIQTGSKLYCWAGGGIVADSELDDEYQESLTKVANLTGITR